MFRKTALLRVCARWLSAPRNCVSKLYWTLSFSLTQNAHTETKTFILGPLVVNCLLIMVPLDLANAVWYLNFGRCVPRLNFQLSSGKYSCDQMPLKVINKSIFLHSSQKNCDTVCPAFSLFTQKFTLRGVWNPMFYISLGKDSRSMLEIFRRHLSYISAGTDSRSSLEAFRHPMEYICLGKVSSFSLCVGSISTSFVVHFFGQRSTLFVGGISISFIVHLFG